MLFKFLTYLQPTHYFSLAKLNGDLIFPDLECLPKAILETLEPDTSYKSTTARIYDLSWQALHKGYIGDLPVITTIEKLPLEDNYRFVRKYFNAAWVFYVFMVRIFSFNNPFKEFSAWFRTRHIKRSQYLKQSIQYTDWFTFKSNLLQQHPKVSIIIPTLNRYSYLKDVLHDLEQQDYKNFEVIVVDQSEPFQEQADYLLFFDDDSRVNTDWIRTHLKCLDFFKADISSGVSISQVGAKVPEHYSFFRISDQLDTGNVLIKKEVFKAIGLFDRQFEKQRMGDGEFGLRAYLNGFLNVSNPYAKRLHLKVDSGGLREMGSWDAFRTNKWFSPRPIPSVLYFFRRYFGNVPGKFALLKTVPLSIMPYRCKKNKGMLIFGVFVSIIIFPIVLFQVFRSWRLSSEKLEQGALIERLED
jgi:hypothetical protein